MTRPVLAAGAAALILIVGSGSWWLSRRTPGAPPRDEAMEPFHTAAAGAGSLIDLQPPPTPLRSVRWAAPLPGGAAVAQILTQTGRQQVVLFLQGAPGPAVSLPEPAGVADSFFQFADLADAVLAPDEALVLLYRSASDAASPALVLAWDLRRQQIRWTERAQGEHLAMSPDRRCVFLYGAGTPIRILDLAARGASQKPAATTVELPAEVKGISSLLPTASRAFLVARESGLSVWRNGVWSHLPAPPPSPLGFSRGLGLVAGSAKAGWWQPEPGVLIPLDPEGRTGAPRDLKPLLPESDLDASLLRLLGEEPDGHLWFSLARPSLLASAPAPASAPIPPAAPEDAAASASAIPEAAPAPQAPASQAPAQPSREAMEAHLAKGLDRLYRWKPGEDRMKAVLIGEAWKRLSPPPGIPAPAGEGALRPEAEALLCGGPDRVWWLPLKALLAK